MIAKSKLRCGWGAWTAAFVILIGSGWSSVSAIADVAPHTITLTADQITAIHQMVQTALASIDPSLTGPARQQAISQALAKVMTDAIQIYGSSAIATVAGEAILAGIPTAQAVAALLPVASTSAGVPGAVANVLFGAVLAGASATQTAEALIAVGLQAQYTGADIGTGLGMAAAWLLPSNAAAATQIAAVMANEGTPAMRTAYAAAVLQNGGTQQLADAGSANPTAAGEIPGFGGNPQVGGNPVQGSAGTTLPPCSNPSCT